MELGWLLRDMNLLSRRTVRLMEGGIPSFPTFCLPSWPATHWPVCLLAALPLPPAWLPGWLERSSCVNPAPHPIGLAHRNSGSHSPPPSSTTKGHVRNLWWRENPNGSSAPLTEAIALLTCLSLSACLAPQPPSLLSLLDSLLTVIYPPIWLLLSQNGMSVGKYLVFIRGPSPSI